MPKGTKWADVRSSESESSVDPKPAGLINALARSGIQAAEGGGWTTSVHHSRGQGAKNAGDEQPCLPQVDDSYRCGEWPLEADRLLLGKLKKRMKRIYDLGGQPVCGACGGPVDEIGPETASGLAGFFECDNCEWVGVPELPPPPKGKANGKRGKGG